MADQSAIIASIRLGLDQLEQDVKSAEAQTERLAISMKKEGKKAGDGFLAGMKKGFQELNKQAERLEQFGQDIVKSFAPMGRLLSAITAVVKKIIDTVHKYNVEVKEAAAVNAILSKDVKTADLALAAYEETVKNAKDRTEELRMKNLEVIESYRQYKTALADLESQFASGRLSREQFIEGNLTQERIRLEQFEATISELSPTLSAAIDDLARLKREHSEYIVEYNRLMAEGSIGEARLYAPYIAEIEETERKVAELQASLKAAYEQADRQRTKVNDLAGRSGASSSGASSSGASSSRASSSSASREETREEKIAAARLAAVERYRRAEQAAQDAKNAGLIDEETRIKQVDAALATQYADLEAIVAEYKLMTGVTVRLRNETAETLEFKNAEAEMLEKEKRENAARLAAGALLKQAEKERLELLTEQEDVLAQQEIERERANGDARKAVELETALIVKQREREKETLMATRAFIHASGIEQDKMLADFDAITDGMARAVEAVAEETKDAWLSVGKEGLSAAVEIGNTLMRQAQSNLEEWIAKIDVALEDELGRIEDMRQKALEVAGFAEAQRAEDMDAEIAAARESGDRILEDELKRRQKEMRINEDFDAQARAAQEKAENEKNRLEYESAKISYALQIVGAGNMIAQAILSAWTIQPPWLAPVMAGIAGAAGAVQLGVLLANPPKAPAPVHLADGGFVPGPRAAGDTIPIMATAGELVLNQAQQEHVAEALAGSTQAIIYLQLDRETIGAAVAEWANQTGGVFLARAVRK